MTSTPPDTWTPQRRSAAGIPPPKTERERRMYELRPLEGRIEHKDVPQLSRSSLPSNGRLRMNQGRALSPRTLRVVLNYQDGSPEPA